MKITKRVQGSGRVKLGTGRACRVSLTCCLMLIGVLLLPFSMHAAENAPKGYPKEFSETGTFEGIFEGSIVIDDRKYEPAEGVRFNIPGNLSTNSSRIEKGGRVGFVLDDNGKVVSIWLLPDGFELK